MLFLRRFTVIVVVVLVHALVLYKLRPHVRPPPDDEPRYAVQLISVEAATDSTAEPSAAIPESSASAPSPVGEPASEPNGPAMAPPVVKEPTPTPQPDKRDEPPVEPPTPAPEVAKPSPATETANGSGSALPNESSNAPRQDAVAPDAAAQAHAGTSASKPDDEELYRVAPSWTAVGLHNPRPTYPPTSLRLGEAGEVVVSVFVSEAGKAIDAVVKTSSGFDRLDENALESVLTWRFRPGTYRGVPQAQWVNVPVQYDPSQYAATPR